MRVSSILMRIAAAALCTLVCASCSFDSSLGDVTCDREGVRDGDRVCRDGFWVPADQADAELDTDDTSMDVEPDIVPDTQDADDADDANDADDAKDAEDVSDVVDAEDTDTAPPTCTAGETQTCFPFTSGTAGTGLCESGLRPCENGEFGACEGATGPQDETCDGEDNDCDGIDDNGFPDKGEECTVGTGACRRTGTFLCTASGGGVECSESPGTPSDEICNNQVDEDCNGELDNGCPRTESACADGADNDQDGFVDCEDDDCDDQACGTGTGALCDFGQTECLENTCDGVDNDEDGVVDDGCDNDGDNYCDSGFTVTTDDACGESTAGDASTYDCNDEDSNINPGATEQCDGVDSDCDTTDDENDADATNYCRSNGPNGSDCRLKQGSYCCDRSPAGGC